MSRYVKISSISCMSCHLKDKPAGVDPWEYVIDHLEKQIRQVLPDHPDLIVLPEACDTPDGFESNAQRKAYLNLRGDKVRCFLQKLARENHCYITYPAQYELDGYEYNTCQMIDRNGEIIGIYKKNYPTIGELEIGILPGEEATVFDCDFGRVCALICFDLNFEEYRKRVKKQHPDLVVFCTQFNGALLENLFAYETRSYLVSALGVLLLHGRIIAPTGKTIRESTTHYNYMTETLNLDYALCHIDYNFEKLKAIKEKYGAKVRIDDPCDLGSVMVVSETDEITAKEIFEEFDIQPLDAYFSRAEECRNRVIAQTHGKEVR